VRPLRILHVVANRWWTGSADPALGLAASQRDLGHAVTFACIRGDALEAQARAAGLPPVDGVSLERTASPLTIAADVRRIRRLVREGGVEVVHAHQTHDHWLAAVATRGLTARLVRTVHHRRAVHRDPLSRWLFRATGAVIAVSAGIAASARLAGVPPDRVWVVPGAVDVSRFTPGEGRVGVRAELALGERPVVGCVARLVSGRRHDLLVRAAARVRERMPGLRLVLVGRGEGRPAIEALVQALGLGECVLFAGYRGDDLPHVLAAMDCFALLGTGSEESCRAVLEAMAAGLPVVAARVGAIPETVMNGETGWVVEPDPGEVAARIEALLVDPTRARAMGSAGRERVARLFTPSRRAAAVDAVYRGLIERRP
jgi:glycosyltransferase involved in cell wall biosynthesis